MTNGRFITHRFHGVEYASPRWEAENRTFKSRRDAGSGPLWGTRPLCRPGSLTFGAFSFCRPVTGTGGTCTIKQPRAPPRLYKMHIDHSVLGWWWWWCDWMYWWWPALSQWCRSFSFFFGCYCEAALGCYKVYYYTYNYDYWSDPPPSIVLTVHLYN